MQIWCEGYAATGTAGNAVLIADVDAPTLKAACDIYAAANPEWSLDYDTKRMTYWGCRLFNNEQDARKAFG